MNNSVSQQLNDINKDNNSNIEYSDAHNKYNESVIEYFKDYEYSDKGNVI